MRTPVRTPKVRTRSKVVALFAALTLIGSLSVASALAVHDDGLFELDVNTTPNPDVGDANTADGAAPGDDWATLYAGGGSSFAKTFIPDEVSSAENDFFTGGGSKDTRDIPSWAYATTNDVVPDKDDIADAFAAAYTDPEDDHTQIYFGMDRYDNNGDAEAGFWFFKDTVTLDGSGGFDGVHEVGDVLVLANWGGSNPVGEITVYEWVGGKNPLALIFDSTNADCAVASLDPDDEVCAVVNRTTDNPPWPFLDKGGSQDIRPLELFEAGMDLNDLFGDDVCFASFMATTRSSHSTTAQLKDFTLGQFEQCGAAITIEADDTNEVNDPHTFTVTVTQSTGGSSSPVEGAFPEVTLTASNGAVVDPDTDTCADDGTNTGTDSNGECTVTFTSASAGVITGHAEATVTIGDDDFFVETNGEAPNSDDAVKTFVDASIAIAPDDVNEVGQPHTFIATALVDYGDGAGLVPVDDGTLVAVTLMDSNGSTVDLDTDECGTTGTVNGLCDVTFTSPTAGVVIGHASFSVTIDGVTLTRDTEGNSGPDGGDGADKRFVDAFITINPPEATNNVSDPHTFTVHVEQNSGDGNGFVDVPDGTFVTVTLVDSNGADSVVSSDTCAEDPDPTVTDDGTVDGDCTVTFTSATSGTVTGNASVTLTISGLTVTRDTDPATANVGAGPGGSGPAVKHFITGALQILKDSTKGGPVATAGAVFSVDGPLLPDDFTVTDNGANDGDDTVGVVCVGGVTPGANYTVNEVTPPPGYGEATEIDLVAVGVSGTCETAVFGAANTATFVNAPLFDIQVNFGEGESTEISLTSITCDGDSTLDGAPATGWDASKTTLGIEFEDEDVDPSVSEMTIEGTIVVDP